MLYSGLSGLNNFFQFEENYPITGEEVPVTLPNWSWDVRLAGSALGLSIEGRRTGLVSPHQARVGFRIAQEKLALQ